MNDLETLRVALHAPTPDPGTVDLERIMAEGRRVRRRRRLLGAGTVAGLLVAAVLGSVAWTVRPPQPLPERPAVTVGQTVSVQGEPPLGDIIAAGGDRVFYFVAIDDPQLPRTHFGLLAGHRDAAGTVHGDVMSNEVDRLDRSAGFHGVTTAMGVEDVDVPAFGYFVGPVARIVGVVDGRRIAARQAAWSENPRVVVFWFDLADVPLGSSPSRLAAYDRDGNRL
jgi:hypothetical protein